MNYVVGSGPSGTACAKALLDRGLSVTMLDTGIDLEPSIAEHRDRLSRTSPDRWPMDSAAAVKAGMTVSPSGVPLKRVFGSDFPFREPRQAVPIRQGDTRALRSFARGGLSRAWGATIVPMAAEDIQAWPIQLSDLAPHYESVMRWLPLAAASDGLDELFSHYCDSFTDIRPSRQAQSILDNLVPHTNALKDRGVFFGRARLAVRGRSEGSRAGCIYCRQCMYGCPYSCIFSSDQELAELERHPRFVYRNNVLVTNVREGGEEVYLDALDLARNQAIPLSGERVFLACGVLTTSQLLMQTLELAEVQIQTSQSFLLPLLMQRTVKHVRREEAHALSQIFLVVRDPAISRRLIQLQIYTYSDLITEALKNSFVGPALRVLPFLQGQLEDRLVVLQGLLPSEQSDALVLKRIDGEFVLTGEVTPRTRATIDRIARAVGALGASAKFRPVRPMLRIASLGQSFHSGASFPMAANPGPQQSDLLGRPGGLRRIHAVDATVLPDIPGPPLTLTVMANAHRIGSHAG